MRASDELPKAEDRKVERRIYREHPEGLQLPEILTRSRSVEGRPQTRNSTPVSKNPIRIPGDQRKPRAPSSPLRRHSPRRLRQIEEDIQRVERALRDARQQAQIEDAERRKRWLITIERVLRNLYDQQDAETELEYQVRIVRENQATFQTDRRDGIPREMARPLTIHQTLLRPRATRERVDLEDRGSRIIDEAMRNERERREGGRREEGENRVIDAALRRNQEEIEEGRRSRREGDVRLERRDASAHGPQNDRIDRGRAQRRNTIVGVRADGLSWDDD